MAITRSTIEVAVDHSVRVSNDFLHHDSPAECLLVILPGRNYLPSHPALHYLQLAGLQSGFDVLAVHYGFQVAPDRFAHDNIDGNVLLDEARRAFRVALDKGYRRVCIAGKSLGTPLAVALCDDCLVQQTSLILLTPVGRSVLDVGDHRTLTVIGTADPLYDAAQVKADKRPNVTWKVMKNLNHGLEDENDWRASARALEQITAACEAFLREVATGA